MCFPAFEIYEKNITKKTYELFVQKCARRKHNSRTVRPPIVHRLCIGNIKSSLSFSYFSYIKAHIPLEFASASANFRVANAENIAQTT